MVLCPTGSLPDQISNAVLELGRRRRNRIELHLGEALNVLPVLAMVLVAVNDARDAHQDLVDRGARGVLELELGRVVVPGLYDRLAPFPGDPTPGSKLK